MMQHLLHKKSVPKIETLLNEIFSENYSAFFSVAFFEEQHEAFLSSEPQDFFSSVEQDFSVLAVSFLAFFFGSCAFTLRANIKAATAKIDVIFFIVCNFKLLFYLNYWNKYK